MREYLEGKNGTMGIIPRLRFLKTDTDLPWPVLMHLRLDRYPKPGTDLT